MCLYVDDMVYTDSSCQMEEMFKRSMMQTFEMSDLGSLHYFLGIEVVQDSLGIFIYQ